MNHTDLIAAMIDGSISPRVAADLADGVYFVVDTHCGPHTGYVSRDTLMLPTGTYATAKRLAELRPRKFRYV